MMNYEMKVSSSGVYIWGSKNLNTDIVAIGSSYLMLKNEEHGEPIELSREPNVGGEGGIFAVLQPGEVVSFSLENGTGIFCRCITNYADSRVP